jgi:hypothetical protein
MEFLMKTLLALEETAMLALAIVLLNWLPIHISWWIYPILAIGPDISMLGYTANNKVGAFFYNLFHHKGVAIVLFIWGLFAQLAPLQIAGLILFGHSSLDRVVGYGLKYQDDFKHTSLGWMNKK